METVKKAIKNEFDVDLKDQNLELIVDGGSENNNKTIAEFIKSCHVNINKKIALKDVTFSNSIVEDPYKIMKYIISVAKKFYLLPFIRNSNSLSKITTTIDLVASIKFTLQAKSTKIPNWQISNSS